MYEKRKTRKKVYANKFSRKQISFKNEVGNKRLQLILHFEDIRSDRKAYKLITNISCCRQREKAVQNPISTEQTGRNIGEQFYQWLCVRHCYTEGTNQSRKDCQ